MFRTTNSVYKSLSPNPPGSHYSTNHTDEHQGTVLYFYRKIPKELFYAVKGEAML